MLGKVRKPGDIPIDRNYAVPAIKEQSSVAPGAARDVEDIATIRDEVRKSNDPIRRIHARILTQVVRARA